MKKTKDVYVNAKQEDFLNARQKDKVWIGGRGSGKSTTIGFDVVFKLKNLPRAKFFFASTTYNQILTKTLPACIQIWSILGFNEHESDEIKGHYVIGKKPPKEWKRAYSPPRSYKNVISFWNGFCIELLSMDRADLARGGSYDGGWIDECALIKREHITQVLYPSIRGNTSRFSHWGHQQLCYFTSMPWKGSGQWILDYEQKAIDDPELYYYQEATAFDNIEIITEEGIERLRRELSFHEFQVEVMNERIKRVKEGFYPKFSEEKHCYNPSFNFGNSKNGILVKGQLNELNTARIVDISLDFSGWFNCMTIYQNKGNTEYMLDAMFVKPPNGIDALIDKFCLEFINNSCKIVHVYGEPRGHDLTPDGDTYFNKVKVRFQYHGWKAVIKAHGGRTTNHDERRNYLDDVLGEEYQHLPVLRMNEKKTKWVAIAMMLTETDANGNKNKSKEKDRNFPQEKAPHITDTVDYFMVQKYKRSSFPMRSGSAVFS